MELKIDKTDLKNLRVQIEKTFDDIEIGVKRALVEAGYIIGNAARDLMKSGPGRSGQEYRRGAFTHKASAWGEPAKSDSGNMVNSLRVVALKHGVNVGWLEGIAPYAKYLEDPTKMNRLVLLPAYQKNQKDIEKRIARAIERSLS